MKLSIIVPVCNMVGDCQGWAKNEGLKAAELLQDGAERNGINWMPTK